MMRAARAYEGADALRLEEIERPAPGLGEVLIEVKAAGLAPGVLEQWRRGMYPVLPRTLGNEAAGVIAELGADVDGLTVGQRVRLHPNLCCRNCEYCRTGREQFCSAHSVIGQGIYGPTAMPMYTRYINGCLADYVLAPAWLADPLPDSVSFDDAAKVHDIADALQAWRTTGVGPGSTVVFSSATGAIGSVFMRMAPLLGVDRVIAVARSAERLAKTKALDPNRIETVATDELGEDWGATQALTKRIRELVPGGVDAVLDFTPEGPTTWQSVAALKTAGTAALMGPNLYPTPLPAVAFLANGWRVAGTRGCTHDDAKQILRWLESGRLKVDDLITHRFSLADIGGAEKLVRERYEPAWMVVIQP
jgi:threonine dehydrogenase-like Zn-dependent dehydrogenase